MLTYCTFNFSCPFSCTRKIFNSAQRTLIWTSPNKTNGWSYASMKGCQSGPARETSDKLHRCSTIPPNQTTLSSSQVLLGPQPQARAHTTGGFLHHLVLLTSELELSKVPYLRNEVTPSKTALVFTIIMVTMTVVIVSLADVKDSIKTIQLARWKWKNHWNRKVTCSLSGMQDQNMYC